MGGQVQTTLGAILARALTYGRRLGKLAATHVDHPWWLRIMVPLAHLWDIVARFWRYILAGVVTFNGLVALITHGPGELPNPWSWWIVQFAVAHPRASASMATLIGALLLVAFVAHRIQRSAPDVNLRAAYVLQRVCSLNPTHYIQPYVEAVYLSRRETRLGGDADVHARVLLTKLASGERPTMPNLTIGICVFGRPMQGKTRLAWEAMRECLPDWTLIKWPYLEPMQTPLDFKDVSGRRIVLWLDDLQKYVRTGQAPTISDLPRRFGAAGAQVAIVATCRDGEDAAHVNEHLHDLMERLLPIWPDDIRQDEAQALVAAFGDHDVPVYQEFDGTPGSLLLGVQRMAHERYPTLPTNATALLKAMKLLYSSGIYTYPERRVRAVASALFGLSDGRSAYQEACGALSRAGFIHLGLSDPWGRRPLIPVADAYLEHAVLDYPQPGCRISDDWFMLQAVLLRHRDANGLISLAAALSELKVSIDEQVPNDLRLNKRRAEECLRGALLIFRRSTAPIAWAAVQNDLGAILRERAELAGSAEQAVLLRRAASALNAAADIYDHMDAEKHIQLDIRRRLAVVQNNLGTVRYHQSQLVMGHRRALRLRQAERAFRFALHLGGDGGDTHGMVGVWNNLGNVHAAQALLAAPDRQVQLLDQTVKAYRAAMAGCRREVDADSWARTQNHLGIALYDRALVSTGAIREELLHNAERAQRAALEVYTRATNPLEWARVEYSLGNTLTAQADLAPSATARSKLLCDGERAYRCALAVRTRESTPMDWALTQNSLGGVLLKRAEFATEKDRGRLLEQAIVAFRAALLVRLPEHLPAGWAMTQQNLGAALHMQADLRQGGGDVAVLREAVTAYRAALSVRTREHAPIAWAMTQNNIGAVLRELAVLADDLGECALLIEQAEDALRGALTIFTPTDSPHLWASAQVNLGQVLVTRVLRNLDADAEAMAEEALGAYRRALTVRTREQGSVDWAVVQHLVALLQVIRAGIATERGDISATIALFEDASQCVGHALSVLTEDSAPEEHAQLCLLRTSLDEAIQEQRELLSR